MRYTSFFYGISDNVASLVQSDKCGVINTAYTTTDIFYIIKFISEAYTLQNHTQIYGQFIYSGELFIKAQYLCSLQ